MWNPKASLKEDEERSRANRVKTLNLIEVLPSTTYRQGRQPQAWQSDPTIPEHAAHDTIEVLPLYRNRHAPVLPASLQMPTPQGARVARETAQAARIAGIDVPDVNTVLGRIREQEPGPSGFKSNVGRRR